MIQPTESVLLFDFDASFVAHTTSVGSSFRSDNTVLPGDGMHERVC